MSTAAAAAFLVEGAYGVVHPRIPGVYENHILMSIEGFGDAYYCSVSMTPTVGSFVGHVCDDECAPQHYGGALTNKVLYYTPVAKFRGLRSASEFITEGINIANGLGNTHIRLGVANNK